MKRRIHTTTTTASAIVAFASASASASAFLAADPRRTRRRRISTGILWVSLLVLSGWGAPLWGADHINLEEGLPIQVTDAYPIPFRGYELQAVSRYDRTDEGENLFLLEPRFEAGLLPNFQGSLKIPFLFRSSDTTGSGNLEAQFFYNFNMESIYLPAVSLAVSGEFPTGRDASGVAITGLAVLTKTLPSRYLFHRVHLNVAWTYSTAPAPDEREGRYSARLGYQIRSGPDTMVVAALLREQLEREGLVATTGELGLRRQITPSLVLAGAVGLRFFGTIPHFRGTVGFQYALPF